MSGKRNGTARLETPSDKKEGEVIDGRTGKAEPTPRRIDLSTLRDVRLELAHVYREMDAGRIEDAAGTKRAYVLKTVADVLALSELEKRIQELEDRQAQALPAGSNQRALPERILN